MTQKELTKQYNAQLRRLKRQEERMRLRGYSFETETGDYVGFVPTKTLVRPTARSVEKLRQISRMDYYKHGMFVDPYTGELMTAAEGRKAEKRRAHELGKKRKEATPMPKPEPKPEPTGGMSANDTKRSIVELLKYSSGLLEYGGWIKDEGGYNGQHGISHTNWVKQQIAVVEAMLDGSTDDEIQLAWDMIVASIESQMVYESFAEGLGHWGRSSKEEFKSWERYFDEVFEAVKNALTDARLALR